MLIPSVFILWLYLCPRFRVFFPWKREKIPRGPKNCSSTTGWVGSNCPFADKSPWWMPSWLLADNNQHLSVICPLLLKLLPWILHIPTCVPRHFYLDSPPLLGIFCGWFSSQCWSHSTPFPQDLSNIFSFPVLPHWVRELFSAEIPELFTPKISSKGARVAQENWKWT